jgi:hypothetical protein
MKTIRLIAFFILLTINGIGHPMPNSVFRLHLKPTGVEAELQLPISELQLALPFDVSSNPATLVARLGDTLTAYIIAHTHPVSFNGKPWTVSVKKLSVGKAEQTATGPYQELTVLLWLEAPENERSRQFNLFYDGIIHQLVTHKIMVAIKQDQDSGPNDSTQTEVGVIQLDVVNNTIHPLTINLKEDNRWKNFTSMVTLGADHIAEGTDHLLFLLVLLLPATLLVSNKRWAMFGGTRYSLVNLLKIVTAFTIGHSVSLLLGAMQWLVLPQQPVEIAIAFTILITAVHAIRPVFPGKEIYVAAVFGIIHGLAFATVLTALNLDAGKMALSILGFNIGIELMQIFIVICTVPWLIMLSKNNTYTWLRIGGAIAAIVASLAWAAERITAHSNCVAESVQKIAEHGPWLLPALAVAAILSTVIKKIKARA